MRMVRLFSGWKTLEKNSQQKLEGNFEDLKGWACLLISKVEKEAGREGN